MLLLSFVESLLYVSCSSVQVLNLSGVCAVIALLCMPNARSEVEKSMNWHGGMVCNIFPIVT